MLCNKFYAIVWIGDKENDIDLEGVKPIILLYFESSTIDMLWQFGNIDSVKQLIFTLLTVKRIQ